MAKIDLGIYKMHWEGEYDSSLSYTFDSVVKSSGKIWCCTDFNGALSGESPGVSGKWELMLNGNTLNFGNDVVLYTDSSGNIQELQISQGYLRSNGGNLSFGALNPQPTIRTVTNLQSNILSRNYGYAIITNKDELLVAGYYNSSNVQNSPSAATNHHFREIDSHERIGSWVSVITTYYTLYAITDAGELFVVGRNNYGNFGLNTTTDVKTLTKVPLQNVKKVVVSGSKTGVHSAYAITTDGKCYSAGYNGYGQLGLGNTTTTKVFTEITGFNGKVLDIAVAEHHYGCVLFMTDESSNNLYSCGRGSYGAQGLGNTTQNNSIVNQNKTVKGIVVKGTYSSYVSASILLSDGSIESAGYNSAYNLGVGTSSAPTTWTQLGGGFTGFVEVHGSDSYNGTGFAINANKELYGWGYNGYGQLGMNNTTNQISPVKPNGSFQGKVSKIVQHNTYNGQLSLVLTTDGEVWFAGYSGKIQSGIDTINKKEFVKVPIKPRVGQIIDIVITGDTTSSTVMFLSSNGDIYVSGANAYGESGLGLAGQINRITKVFI